MLENEIFMLGYLKILPNLIPKLVPLFSNTRASEGTLFSKLPLRDKLGVSGQSTSRNPKYSEGDSLVIPITSSLHKLVGANRT